MSFKTADGDQNLKQAHEIICPDQTVFSFPVRGRADSLKFVILAVLIRFRITDEVKLNRAKDQKNVSISTVCIFLAFVLILPSQCYSVFIIRYPTPIWVWIYC